MGGGVSGVSGVGVALSFLGHAKLGKYVSCNARSARSK